MKHLFWFFLLPIFSCSTSQEPAGEPFNYSAYKKMDVGFKNSTILIPNYYKEVTMADFRDNTANLFSDSLELEIRLKGF